MYQDRRRFRFAGKPRSLFNNRQRISIFIKNSFESRGYSPSKRIKKRFDFSLQVLLLGEKYSLLHNERRPTLFNRDKQSPSGWRKRSRIRCNTKPFWKFYAAFEKYSLAFLFSFLSEAANKTSLDQSFFRRTHFPCLFLCKFYEKRSILAIGVQKSMFHFNVLISFVFCLFRFRCGARNHQICWNNSFSLIKKHWFSWFFVSSRSWCIFQNQLSLDIFLIRSYWIKIKYLRDDRWFFLSTSNFDRWTGKIFIIPAISIERKLNGKFSSRCPMEI